MLFLSITRPFSTRHLQPYNGLAIELRLDLFPCIDTDYVKDFIKTSVFPVMLTIRKISQGGKFQGTESQREALIRQLLALEPRFIDLEYDMSPLFLDEVARKYPKTKLVLSYHNFQGIPTDLDDIYRAMAERAAYSYKIAVMTPSTNDALRMLLFGKRHPGASVICMGENGRFARVLGPIVGNLVDYASIGTDTAEHTGLGQLSFSELIDVYHYHSLNTHTSIYGLIGDPIEKSPGHVYHNDVFHKQGLNAVYVKMKVKQAELSEFIPLAKAMGIRGLSVTIPLKEKILPFIEETDPAAKQIGAVNTLLINRGEISGINTDGLGALDAIEKKIPVYGKKVVLLGAGGAARGIAFEANARGADVLVLNRTIQRAKDLAAALGCKAGGLDEMPKTYDILINCSPGPMLPIDSKKILTSMLAMDVVYSPRETNFIKEAILKQCQIVYGEEMFLNQASRQTAFWMGA